jgi:hypothetical protein
MLLLALAHSSRPDRLLGKPRGSLQARLLCADNSKPGAFPIELNVTRKNPLSNRSMYALFSEHSVNSLVTKLITICRSRDKSKGINKF